ncbi:MAG TPA: tetratricopeptide repeat protein, partial [Candidatus Sulfotelmatobacter sp.]|nr:tetratricopeptide repeat protein [Candidatus Sulfotelmatobacter sp.]
MTLRFRLGLFVTWGIFTCGLLGAQSRNLDQSFQAALADYNAAHFPQAASKLEALVAQLPNNFDVHELLGLVYSAESLDGKATEHLQKAVSLKPASAAARANLAANLVRRKKLDLAEVQFVKAAELEPNNFDTNHNLGELYIQRGKLGQALVALAKAQRINPSSYDNGYDLARAYLLTGQMTQARETISSLIAEKNTAELHNLLAEVEEKEGKFVAAANQYETAAHMEPSESNLFDWGSELLVHRTLDPSVEVFKKATELYPKSARLAVGLGMALYARGNYEDAVKSLLRAADLNPSDPGCYLFLSRAYDSSPNQADEVMKRFRRYAQLQPRNARALYYYAMSSWKGKRMQQTDEDLSEIARLLKSSIALDEKFPEAHLQLGNLYSDQRQYAV